MKNNKPNKLDEICELARDNGKIKDLAKKIAERIIILKIIDKIPETKPEYESDDYDNGRKDFKKELIELI